jgi:hypothetical protein
MKRIDAEKIEKEGDERHQIENQFIIKQLMNILMYVDFSDTHGKYVIKITIYFFN